MNSQVAQSLLNQKLQFTCQHYDKESLVIPDQANMANFKLENTQADWPDATVNVQGKIDQMIIQENQKAVNAKRFKKH